MARDQGHSLPVRFAAELLVLALLAAAVASYRFDLGERWFGWGPVDPAAEPALVLPPEGLRLPVSRPAPAVAKAGTHVDVDPAQVALAVNPLLRGKVLGPHYAVLVQDLATGREVFRAGASSIIPASTTKLLTSVAALETLGPTTRFATTVRWSPQSRRLTLVGGGDPFLVRTPASGQGLYPQRADLTTLARRTAAALEADGVSRVRLSFDDHLFSGPEVNPTWPAAYLDDVTSPISALWVDEARADSGYGFVADPAAGAGTFFARALRQAGVTVVGSPSDAAAPAGAREVAAVRSATVGEIVERTLAVSDNQAAEVLARHVGVATGGQGSFAGGAAAVLDTVRELGVPVDGDRLLDGSGLSRSNRLSADTLAGVLRLSESARRPELRQVLTGLPVAGFTGSLQYRFDAGPAQALGRVRAKTGTLMGVHGLAGVADDPTGARMAFVVVADRVDAAVDLDARVRVDRIAAALGACRCGVGSPS